MDPAFQRFAALTSEPNFFSVVGQSRFERWHSAFWGWLFDPAGSHSLDDYVLNRVLISLFAERCLKPKNFEDFRNLILTRVDFRNISVHPNEYDSAWDNTNPFSEPIGTRREKAAYRKWYNQHEREMEQRRGKDIKKHEIK